MERSDEELVVAARSGDASSFGLLYERYYRLAVGISRSRLSDVHLAEDAAQEAFATACRTISTLRKPERFAEWLGTICRRCACRIAAARSPHALPRDESARVTDSGTLALREQVQEALDSLDDRPREIVVLRYFSGLSHEEIGRTLGLSAASVHGHLQRARTKLALVLDPSGAEL